MRVGGAISIVFAGLTISSALLSILLSPSSEGDTWRATTATVESLTVETTGAASEDTTNERYIFVLRGTTDAGEPIAQRMNLSSRNVERYGDLTEGDTLPIRYTLEEPRQVRLGTGSRAQREGLVMQGISLLFGGVTLFALWASGQHAVAAVRARRYGRREMATVTGLRKAEIMGNEVRRQRKNQYRLTWREADGREGASLMAPRDAFADIPVGEEIAIYKGKKHAWWVGDVGERPDATR